MQEVDTLNLLLEHNHDQLRPESAWELVQEVDDFFLVFDAFVVLEMALALNEHGVRNKLGLVQLLKDFGLGLVLSVLLVGAGQNGGNRTANEGKRDDADDHDEGGEDLLLWHDSKDVAVAHSGDCGDGPVEAGSV